MRATVFFAPMACAMMHEVMLRLSSGVTATKMSAPSVPASLSVLMLVGEPSMVIMSYSLSSLFEPCGIVVEQHAVLVVARH